MKLAVCILLLGAAASAIPAHSQSSPASPAPPNEPPQSVTVKSRRTTLPPSSRSEYSSSRKYVVDLSPPLGDLQEHPDSAATLEATGVNELTPWDPHRAAKDIEVGDFYLKQENFRGAEMRYRDALLYKPNDAVATFRLGQVCERTGRPAEALKYYKSYLKILPEGPFAKDAKKAEEKIEARLQSAR